MQCMFEPGCAKAVTKRNQEIDKAIFQKQVFEIPLNKI